jgi:polyisoprenoid-binding protein YceI
MADSTGTHGAGTYQLGPESGRVLVRTGREGLAARAGHDLTLEITDWLAQVTTPGEAGGVAEATVTADLGLASLTVREGTGGAKPLTDRDRREIKKQVNKILGDSARASFTSQQIIPSPASSAGSPAAGAIEGTLTMHGVSRGVRLEVTSQGPGRYRGTATIKQTDFGITPYSGFFGALKLRDEVTVEFDVTIEGLQNGGA